MLTRRVSSFISLAALALTFCVLPVGCSRAQCQTDSDCSSGQSCVYPLSDGCLAKGECEGLSSTTNCTLIAQYCGCDGSIVSVQCGLSGGPAPVEGPYATSCGHGTKDAGGPCNTNSDCGQGQGCYYPIADGCSAKGQCLENPSGAEGSGCELSTVYCACDGRSTERVCDGHDGYVGAPVSRAVATVDACSSNDAGLVLIPLPDGGPK